MRDPDAKCRFRVLIRRDERYSVTGHESRAVIKDRCVCPISIPIVGSTHEPAVARPPPIDDRPRRDDLGCYGCTAGGQSGAISDRSRSSSPKNRMPSSSTTQTSSAPIFRSQGSVRQPRKEKRRLETENFRPPSGASLCSQMAEQIGSPLPFSPSPIPKRPTSRRSSPWRSAPASRRGRRSRCPSCRASRGRSRRPSPAGCRTPCPPGSRRTRGAG